MLFEQEELSICNVTSFAKHGLCTDAMETDEP